MKRFDKNFEEEAVRLVLNLGRPVPAVAKELGIHEKSLYKWLSQYKTHKEHAFPGSDNLRPGDEDTMRLKENDSGFAGGKAILKKATAIFAKHQK